MTYDNATDGTLHFLMCRGCRQQVVRVTRNVFEDCETCGRGAWKSLKWSRYPDPAEQD